MADEDVAQTGGPLSEETLRYAEQMFDLARIGDVDMLAAHLDAGLPVNLTNAAGDSLLILAAYHEHTETVVELIERGADVARINDKGQDALSAATFRQSEDIVTALLEAGADPEGAPMSAVAVARHFGQPAMLALLTRPRPVAD